MRYYRQQATRPIFIGTGSGEGRKTPVFRVGSPLPLRPEVKMICPRCERETVLVKKNSKVWYLFGGIYLLYVLQKDPHHCVHCGARIGR